MGKEFGIPREEAGVNITAASYSLDNGLLGLLLEFTHDVENYWNTGLDFRLKLLVLLVIWLTVNSLLIKIAWFCYGETFSQMFYIKSGSTSGSTSTGEEPSELPTDNVQEQCLHRE